MKALLIVITLVLVGCSKEPISTNSTNNKGIKVHLLFNHKGCNIYRFYDGQYVYFSECSHSFQTSHTESCGKNCVRTVKDQTLGL